MTNENRLNVLLSRQKSGLVIVGDINIMGKVFRGGSDGDDGDDGKGKGKGKMEANKHKFKGAGGTVSFVRSTFLAKICQKKGDSWQGGRDTCRVAGQGGEEGPGESRGEEEARGEEARDKKKAEGKKDDK